MAVETGATESQIERSARTEFDEVLEGPPNEYYPAWTEFEGREGWIDHHREHARFLVPPDFRIIALADLKLLRKLAWEWVMYNGTKSECDLIVSIDALIEGGS